MEKKKGWKFWVDRGGTFTDVVACKPDGELKVEKWLSDNPQHHDDAAMACIRRIMQIPPTETIPCELIQHLKMGTTVATNALLEHKGEPTVLLTTRGFRDSLRIAYQNRPDLFSLQIRLPSMLYSHVIEADERVDASGEVLVPLDEVILTRDLQKAIKLGYKSVAIVFMHSYQYPDHERKARDLCQELGFSQISVSSELSPLMKLVCRGDTTIVDAYLSPVLNRYLNRVKEEIHDTTFMIMQSHGGLKSADNIHGKDVLLSGPAGGVVGMAKTAARAGIEKVIGFDMGGTSTDVALFWKDYERTYEGSIAGYRVRAPMMNIHTIAAGGGSILKFEDFRFQVGPESAGAMPGPASYGMQGPLTVTDIQVLLGRLRPEYFPSVLGLSGTQPLFAQTVWDRFQSLADSELRHYKKNPVEIAEGFLRIAVENMANSIKKISTQKGVDVTEFTLCCFGGAGGQHACSVADSLGIEAVFIHPMAGVLSAFGMGLADLRTMQEQTLEEDYQQSKLANWNDLRMILEKKVIQDLNKQGVESGHIQTRITLFLKYRGTDSPLGVEWGSYQSMLNEFEKLHQKRFGFKMSLTPLVAEYMSVEAVAEQDWPLKNEPALKRSEPVKPISIHPVTFNGTEYQTPFFKRRDLNPAEEIQGPAIIIEDHTTTVLDPEWRARVSEQGALFLKRKSPNQGREDLANRCDPIMLEVFNNLFMSIAERMGVTLAHTASSVNIKERLDFSCAIFDKAGQLVANAPHMPVHLGSMGESVRAIMKAFEEDMDQGDVFALNAPYEGGTHLPDITVVTPVFGDGEGQPLFYVASRGHHADVGGLTPGSMPAFSRHINQEGVLINAMRIVHDGRFDSPGLEALFSSGPYPARNPQQNLADLKAQIAANEMGLLEMKEMMNHFGRSGVEAYTQHVQDNAARAVEEVLEQVQSGQIVYGLDQGLTIQLRVSVEGKKAVIDFTGTSPQSPDNFNAPLPVCRAAVLYVFRCLVKRPIPLNAGCLRPLSIIVPEGCFLNPRYPAPVVAGNVETSQAIVNALLLAVGAQAASQGTMNNLTFGNDRSQYYETLCGGSGAGPDFDGTSAVHTHMTNSRLTDPEVLEWRYPVILEEFSKRKQSGGSGKYKGGDGAVRQILFKEPMSVSILSSSRKIPPQGLNGGRAGVPGINKCIRADGHTELLAGADQIEVQPGDRIRIETPGGGGFGTAE